MFLRSSLLLPLLLRVGLVELLRARYETDKHNAAREGKRVEDVLDREHAVEGGAGGVDALRSSFSYADTVQMILKEITRHKTSK